MPPICEQDLEVALTWTVFPGRCSSRKQDHASFVKPPNHHEASLGISLLHLGQTRTQVSTLYASASVSTWQPD